MFKKNNPESQLTIFSPAARLSKKKQKLWDKSYERMFFKEIFSKIDEELFSCLYSKNFSRPNTPINQLVGALILKHLYNWTYKQLENNLNFNILTRHALGINNMEDDIFCQASLFNFQNKLITYWKDENIDLLEQVFKCLTLDQLKAFGVNTQIQRVDSFLVGSNIVDYSRLQLLIEVLRRFALFLDKQGITEYEEMLKDYTEFTSSNYVYYVDKKDLDAELEKISLVYFKLNNLVSDKYLEEDTYRNFARIFKEHFELDEATNIKVKPSKHLGSSILMSPDDIDATYRDKRSTNSKGYTTHICETANPENDINLIVDTVTKQNNVDDASILEERLPEMIEQTPQLNKLFQDGLYGNEKVDEITALANIKVYQKKTRGRKSSAGLKIKQDENGNVEVSCMGGQTVKAEISKGKDRFKAIFLPKICNQCPFYKECKLQIIGGKIKESRKAYYFKTKNILIHKRLTNIEELTEKEKFIRANVEATVKEMKRGMKNGKSRVRGWERISIHMILTTLAVNFTRIHKYLENLIDFFKFLACIDILSTLECQKANSKNMEESSIGIILLKY